MVGSELVIILSTTTMMMMGRRMRITRKRTIKSSILFPSKMREN